MSRIAYVNGRYVAHAQATVHIEDRGYQFADGVYEVCEVHAGALIDTTRHIDRLERSLAALTIAMPMSRAALIQTLCEVARRNRVHNGMVYLQVSRGVAARDHGFPKKAVQPALVVTARALDPAAGAARAAAGVDVITTPELRWKRVDIKTTGLTGNVLARQAARDTGAFEAWYVTPDDLVIEGAATNAWIVTRQGKVITHPDDGRILSGVTRATVIDMLNVLAIPFETRAFSVDEARSAAEAFCTGATLLVMPVVRIDGQTVGAGRPGPVATLLRARFHEFAAVGPHLFAAPAGPGSPF